MKRATGKTRAKQKQDELSAHLATLTRGLVSDAVKYYHDRFVVPLEFRLRALERKYEKLSGVGEGETGEPGLAETEDEEKAA